MERLTTRCSGYAVMAWEHEEKHTTQEWIDMLTDRLAAYEELMERWKLRSIEEADRIFHRVNALGGIDLMAQYRDIGSIDHLRDLLQAEQAGRLVVLPCGTDVELVRDGHSFKADHWNHTLTAFRDAPKNKSGKQVALFSIKEAEAALVGKGGKMNRSYYITKDSDGLKKLIEENPELPIVVLAGEDATDGDHSWMYCSCISFSIDEILDCDYLDYGDTVFTDRDRLEEKVTDDLYEEYSEKSEEEYESAVKKKLQELEPYWKKVIAIWATN